MFNIAFLEPTGQKPPLNFIKKMVLEKEHPELSINKKSTAPPNQIVEKLSEEQYCRKGFERLKSESFSLYNFPMNFNHVILL
jgi:hypothetical protein